MFFFLCGDWTGLGRALVWGKGSWGGEGKMERGETDGGGFTLLFSVCLMVMVMVVMMMIMTTMTTMTTTSFLLLKSL